MPTPGVTPPRARAPALRQPALCGRQACVVLGCGTGCPTPQQQQGRPCLLVALPCLPHTRACVLSALSALRAGRTAAPSLPARALCLLQGGWTRTAASLATSACTQAGCARTLLPGWRLVKVAAGRLRQPPCVPVCPCCLPLYAVAGGWGLVALRQTQKCPAQLQSRACPRSSTPVRGKQCVRFRCCCGRACVLAAQMQGRQRLNWHCRPIKQGSLVRKIHTHTQAAH